MYIGSLNQVWVDFMGTSSRCQEFARLLHTLNGVVFGVELKSNALKLYPKAG